MMSSKHMVIFPHEENPDERTLQCAVQPKTSVHTKSVKFYIQDENCQMEVLLHSLESEGYGLFNFGGSVPLFTSRQEVSGKYNANTKLGLIRYNDR
jgi:hypothetical protein